MSELLDADARERIRTDTSSTLFVEAGAGSGKTHALVERVITLVLRDGVPLSTIAAVTFTEKAGAELRDRLRVEFEKARKGPDRAAADEALDDLDSASIGTLHSFAQQILLAHPIEAGLPPLIDVLDEVGSSVAFEERWSELQQQLLDDDTIAEPLLLAMAVGVELKHLRSLARLFGNDWDLISDRVLVDPPELVAMPDLSGLIAAAGKIGSTMPGCLDTDDRMLAKVRQIHNLGLTLEAATDQETQLAHLQALRSLKVGRIGRKENWPDIAKLRADCSEVVDVAGSLVELLLDACLRHLSHWLAIRVLESAELRRAEGRLEFHDLLVLARDLLRREPAVRSALQERYRHLLLDEFQDTDPIQIELAVRIAGGADADAPDWRDVEIPDGSLFVVGDPKQSIYRFRRANIATYLTAQDLLGDTVTLTTNFRTVPGVLDWINTVFTTLITPEPAAQPTYHALAPHRPPASVTPTLTTVTDEPPSTPASPDLNTSPAPVPNPSSAAPVPDHASPVSGDQLSFLDFTDEPNASDSGDISDEPGPSGFAVNADAAGEASADEPAETAHLASVTPLRRHLSAVPTPSDATNETLTPLTSDLSTNQSSTGPAVTILGAEPHDDLPAPKPPSSAN